MGFIEYSLCGAHLLFMTNLEGSKGTTNPRWRSHDGDDDDDIGVI
jgi:hypothetical protein